MILPLELATNTLHPLSQLIPITPYGLLDCMTQVAEPLAPQPVPSTELFRVPGLIQNWQPSLLPNMWARALFLVMEYVTYRT